MALAPQAALVSLHGFLRTPTARLAGPTACPYRLRRTVTTMEAETGLRFPADYRLHVHEESATDAHMVLPPKPELSRDQLDRIAGGFGGMVPWD